MSILIASCDFDDNKSRIARQEEEIRAFNAALRAKTDEETAERIAKAERDRVDARQRAAALLELQAVKPWQRAEMLHKCFKDPSTCPFGGAPTVFEAAANAAERQKLEKNWDKYESLTAEIEQQAAAPKSVVCCDGSLSPSCMCGGSLRGCCSHHHGVCGCE